MRHESQWLTISEAAALHGCTHSNIHQRVQRGCFKAQVVRRPGTAAEYEWRIDRESFETWRKNLRKRQRAATTGSCVIQGLAVTTVA